MSDTEIGIMAEVLQKSGHGVLAAILAGFSGRVETITITHRVADREVSTALALSSPRTEAAE